MVKIILAGTPEFPVPIFEKIINNKNFEVVAIITQPDRPSKRKHKIIFSAVKQLALKYKIKLLQPVNINENSDLLEVLNHDILLTCAYGQFISDKILKMAKLTSLNIHGSLLPSLRGGAPIHHAIINGLPQTGITLMHMEKKMDAGDIIFQSKITIEDNDNFGTVHNKLSELATLKIEDWLQKIITKNFSVIKQSDIGTPTFGLNISKTDRLVKWNENADIINNQIRGLFPWPIAISKYNETTFKITKSSMVDIINQNDKLIPGTVLKVDENGILVKTASLKAILIEEITWPNKSKMKIRDFIKGNNIFNVGEILK